MNDARSGLTPYYDDGGGIQIFHADCRDVLTLIDADVIVTDPPYGMAYLSGWSNATVAGDDRTAVRDDVLKWWGNRPALVFGRWSVTRPPGVRVLLTWDKGDWPGMGDLTLPWGPSTEEVYVMGIGFAGKRAGSVLRVYERPTGTTANHPTEKPVSLMRLLIEKCPAEWVILDPFMGSGSTLRAAKDLGRRCIGIEIEERYCRIAVERLRQSVLPLEAR